MRLVPLGSAAQFLNALLHQSSVCGAGNAVEGFLTSQNSAVGISSAADKSAVKEFTLAVTHGVARVQACPNRRGPTGICAQ